MPELNQLTGSADVPSASSPWDRGRPRPLAVPCGYGSRAYWLAFALVLVLAAALRLLQIGKLELWLDENYSVVMALRPGGVLGGALADTNPPLYLYLLKGWMALFGLSAAAVRSLSAVCGVAQLAALGLWLAACGLPRRAALWAMALGALAPLHVYYSQEARAYTLAWLLLTLALWSFTAAASSGRWRPWLLHAGCMVLVLYTHNLMIFFIPAFWAAGWALRLGRRDWLRMAAAYALVGLLYGPWFIHSARVVQSGSLGWIADNWSPAAAPGLIPASLEALGSGGSIPGIIRMLNPALPLRLAALAWLLAVMAAAFLPLNTTSLNETIRNPQSAIRNHSFRISLLLFILLPLALMLGWSLLLHPMYVVGRYDTLVYPALLALLGQGAWRLQRTLARFVPLRAAAGLVALAPLLVAGAVLPERYRPLTPELYARLHPQEARGAVLKDYFRPGDSIVCLGLEGTRIGYQMLRLGLKQTPLSFPLSTMRHPGYILPREVAADAPQLQRDAQSLLAQCSASGRLWVVLDPYSFRDAAPGSNEAAYTGIAQSLLDALAAQGRREWDDPAFRQRTRVAGLRIYLPPAPSVH